MGDFFLIASGPVDSQTGFIICLFCYLLRNSTPIRKPIANLTKKANKRPDAPFSSSTVHFAFTPGKVSIKSSPCICPRGSRSEINMFYRHFSFKGDRSRVLHTGVFYLLLCSSESPRASSAASLLLFSSASASVSCARACCTESYCCSVSVSLRQNKNPNQDFAYFKN